MDKELRRAVEHELKNLAGYRARLEQLKLDLIDRGATPVIAIRGNFPSDPTGIRVSKELEIKDKMEVLKIRIKRIEIAVDSLIKPEYDLIELRYLMGVGYNNSEVMDKLGVSPRNYYYIRNRAFEKIASILGEDRIIMWQFERLV